MKYFITTYGCQVNEADSERIETRLRLMGHKKAASEKTATLVVINACSVRQSAVDRVLAKIKKYKKDKKKVILAGCILESDKKKFGKLVDEIWHPDEYFDLTPIYSDSPRRAGQASAVVPIMTGCDNFCTYCAVPFTRGREKSRPAKEIIKEVKKLTNNGYKEIWLLGQNVNSYKSNKTTFSKLLRHLNAIADKCSLRFMSPHPKDFSDELIRTIAQCEKVAKNIHLPVQSGDNEILKKMNRNYTREQYIKLINKIKKAMPNIKISTDTIVGFPGETRKQFLNTIDLYKKIKFDKAYVSEYSPRPGTAATLTMRDNVPHKEKERRRKELEKVLKSRRPAGVGTPTKASGDKIIVVLGPTASGKSDLAVKIALRLRSGQARKLGINGAEIISADSRQVYKDMNIGTGKITQKEMKGIKHHLLDIVSPKKVFTAVDFKEKAEKAIQEILEKGKIPIICGGTGFYIHALLGDIKIPKIKPDWKLRKELEKKTTEELFKMLPAGKRAQNIDRKNKRRLIRAIEIATSTSKSDFDVLSTSKSDFDVLWLGIKCDDKKLKKKIGKRVDKMIKSGLEKEVKKLVKKYGWTKVFKNTIGYQEYQTKDSAKNIKLHSIQYAKRQMTWFRKFAPKTKWLAPNEEVELLTRFILTSVV